MVTLTVTASRTALALTGAADVLAREGWCPELRTVAWAFEVATGSTAPGDMGEELTLAAWDALVRHMLWADEALVLAWERAPGRTQADVLAMLRGCAEGVWS